MMYTALVTNIEDQVKALIPGIHLVKTYGRGICFVEVENIDLAIALETMNRIYPTLTADALAFIQARDIAIKATESTRAWHELGEDYLEAIEELRG